MLVGSVNVNSTSRGRLIFRGLFEKRNVGSLQWSSRGPRSRIQSCAAVIRILCFGQCAFIVSVLGQLLCRCLTG